MLAVLGFFQLLSVANGTSYYKDCLSLSDSIRQGDYADGLTFLPKYLLEAERSLGYLLAGLAILSIPVLLWRLVLRFSVIRMVALLADNLLVISMVLAFAWYAYMVYYQQKMVFYGRILHLYMPFFILFIGKVLYPATRRSIQYVAVALVVVVASYSFTVFTLDYHRIVYPITFLHQHINDYPGAKVTTKEQTPTANTDDYYVALDAFFRRPVVAGQPEVVLTNMGFLYPIRDKRLVQRNYASRLIQADL